MEVLLLGLRPLGTEYNKFQAQRPHRTFDALQFIISTARNDNHA